MVSKELQILIVDDNAVNRKVASAMVKKLGFDFDTAESGDEAISKLSENSYSIVFMDLRMPGLDGVSATKIIREESSDVIDHNIPVIALTADDDDGAWKENGFNDFMSKPLKPDELNDIINKWVK